MPLLPTTDYPRVPRYFRNAHVQTIVPALLRPLSPVDYERERLTLSDGDFVDLDWLDGGHRRLLLLSHGLEGDTHRRYMVGMARAFYAAGWDVLAWNCRSCSGEMNRAARLYHHGETEDLTEVIAHALRTKAYGTILPVGFSMGGNMTLKYMATAGAAIPAAIRTAIAFSAPVDLVASAEHLEVGFNKVYKDRFMRALGKKMRLKAVQYPELIDAANLRHVRVWYDFDKYFSAPLFGLADPEALYAVASAHHFIEGIERPVLLVNAQNDPILTPSCSPTELCRTHPHLYLQTPAQGGHVGFWHPGLELAWSERRALDWAAAHAEA